MGFASPMTPPVKPAESPARDAIRLSIVIPFRNEEENVEAVCGEVERALAQAFEGAWELILVDDGSTDATAGLVDALRDRRPNYRALHLSPNGGQSAALQAGFLAARGTFVATLDGDGQNDPRDLVPLLRELQRRRVHMMCGVRARRADSRSRRIMSRAANRIRSAVLRDGITDVGCSLRVFRRSCLRRVILYRNAHRFLPALFQFAGFRVAEMPVAHRPRMRGKSKYGGGFRSRAFVGLVDLLGAWWLGRRRFRHRVREHTPRP